MTDDDTQIPQADESGSSGTQEHAADKVEFLPAKWAGGSKVSDAMDALAAAKSTAFGSEAGTALVVAVQKQAEFDKGLLTERINQLEQKLETLRNDLETERITNAGLQGKLDTQKKLRRVRRLLTVLAGLAVGLGVALSQTDNVGLSLAAFAAAIMCLAGGWFVEDKEGDK